MTLYCHQYGFQAKHSTIHPVLHLLNHCADVYNSNPMQLTLATFCNLSKALIPLALRYCSTNLLFMVYEGWPINGLTVI